MIRADGTAVRSVVEFCRRCGCVPTGDEQDCPRCGTLRRHPIVRAMAILMKRAWLAWESAPDPLLTLLEMEGRHQARRGHVVPNAEQLRK